MEQIIQIYEILGLILMVHIQLSFIHHHSVPKHNINLYYKLIKNICTIKKDKITSTKPLRGKSFLNGCPSKP